MTPSYFESTRGLRVHFRPALKLLPYLSASLTLSFSVASSLTDSSHRRISLTKESHQVTHRLFRSSEVESLPRRFLKLFPLFLRLLLRPASAEQNRKNVRVT